VIQKAFEVMNSAYMVASFMLDMMLSSVCMNTRRDAAWVDGRDQCIAPLARAKPWPGKSESMGGIGSPQMCGREIRGRIWRGRRLLDG
jgi:hypothetical protein